MDPLRLSQTVMDPYAARILLGTSSASASAIDLSQRFGIPIAACYRRIRALQEMGLVFCERELPSRNGKGLQLFRSTVRSVRVVLEEGKLRARVVLGRPGASAPEELQAEEQVLNLA